MMSLLRRSTGASKVCRRRYPSKNDLSLRPLSSESLSSSLQTKEKREFDEANGSFIPSNAPVLGSARLDMYRKHQDVPKDIFYRFSTDLGQRGPRVDSKAHHSRLLTSYLMMESEISSLMTGTCTLPRAVLSDCSFPTSAGISTAIRPAARRSISSTSFRSSGQALLQGSRTSHVSLERLFSTESEGKTPKKAPSPRIGTTKVPTPASPPVQTSAFRTLIASPKLVMQKGTDLTISVFKTVFGFLIRLPGNVWFYISHPTERKERIAGLQQAARDELNHYWGGSKVGES
jgi:hypothetical protein